MMKPMHNEQVANPPLEAIVATVTHMRRFMQSKWGTMGCMAIFFVTFLGRLGGGEGGLSQHQPMVAYHVVSEEANCGEKSEDGYV